MGEILTGKCHMFFSAETFPDKIFYKATRGTLGGNFHFKYIKTEYILKKKCEIVFYIHPLLYSIS